MGWSHRGGTFARAGCTESTLSHGRASLFRVRPLVHLAAFLAAFALVALGPPVARAGPAHPESPWKLVGQGVETATAASLGADAGWAARVVLIDPERASLSVHFDGRKPRLEAWRARAPDAWVIANGSFYSDDGPPDAQIRPTCDLVLMGRLVKGAGCRRRDALVFGAEPGRTGERSSPQTRPRLLAPAELIPGEWAYALKAFPALVRDGKPLCTTGRYCLETSRTAALGILRDGRVFLFAAQWPAVRREVAAFLSESLGAVDAVNLDGGPEVTLALRGQAQAETIGTPGEGLPLVIVVEPRRGRSALTAPTGVGAPTSTP